MSRYPENYGNHTTKASAPGPARRLGTRVPVDLANELTPKVKVSCTLAPEGIIWGRYRNENVAVMHLQLRAIEPPGYKLRHFQLDIRFTSSLPPHSTVGAGSQEQDVPPVWLLQSPSPSPVPEYIEGRPWMENRSQGLTVEPSVQTGAGGGSLGSFYRTTERSITYKWQFRSYPVSDEHNIPTTATWIWESNKNNPQVEDRGTLYGGLALCSTGRDLRLECKVKGKLCKGDWWSRFGTPEAEPGLWWRELGAPTTDIEDHVNSLKEKMKIMNIAAPARESPGACSIRLLRSWRNANDNR
jgi:hypothetical protein